MAGAASSPDLSEGTDQVSKGTVGIPDLLGDDDVPGQLADRLRDISDILARKAEGRRQSAKLTWGQKIELMEALRERLKPFKEARERWKVSSAMRVR